MNIQHLSEKIDNLRNEMQAQHTELKVGQKELDVKMGAVETSLINQHAEILSISSRSNERLTSLERHVTKQEALNEENERKTKHRWIKITALILSIEVIIIGLGFLFANYFPR